MSKRFEEIDLYGNKQVQLNLFDTIENKKRLKGESFFPKYARGDKYLREILENPDTYTGIDLEFDPVRHKSTILGLSNSKLAASAPFSKELARFVVDCAKLGITKLVGYSVVGAEKEELEHALGEELPIEIFEDGMLTHFLLNQDLVKMSGGKEESEKGSMGFLNLWTMNTFYVGLPQFKVCRELNCAGPCPKCLRGESKVYLEDGSIERIEKLVKDNYRGKVLSVDDKGNLVYRKVTNTFRNERNNRKFLRVNYKFNRKQNRGVVVTEDHRFLSEDGYIEAGELKELKIATGTPALTSKQESVIAGILLGDSNIRNGKIIITHGIKQKEYIDLKEKLFNNISLGVKKYTRENCNDCFRLTLKTIPQTRELDYEYKNNLFKFLEKYFCLESLLILYLDDGNYHKYQMSISVQSKTEYEKDFLVKLIKEKIGLNVYHNGGNIIFCAEEAKKFSQMIYKYVPLSLKYKLREEYRNNSFDKDFYELEKEISVYYSEALISEEKPRKGPSGNDCDLHVFCLEVEETNNFVTVGGVVHNCDVWGYNAMDTYTAREGFIEMLKEMERRGIPYQLYRDLLEINLIAQKMQNRGIKVDRDLVEKLDKITDEEKEKLFPYTGEGKKKKYEHFNPNSPAGAIAYFAKNGIELEQWNSKEIYEALENIAEEENTNLDDILKNSSNLPIHYQLLIKGYRYKGAGKGFKSWFDEKFFGEDGLMHPRFLVIGTSTGRFSSRSPNFQNIPRFDDRTPIEEQDSFGLARLAIIPRSNDLCLIKADKSNLELRMCLYYAGFDTYKIEKDAFQWMVDTSDGAYKDAAAFLKMSERDVAKSVAHGSNYGEGIIILYPKDLIRPSIKTAIKMGAIVLYEDWDYCGGKVAFSGINLASRIFKDTSLEARARANQILEGIYFKKFHIIREWHKKVLTELESTGIIRSVTGRFVRFNDTPLNNAKNAFSFLGQGTSADHVQGDMLEFYRVHGNDGIPLLQVHDELVFEKPKTWSDEEAISFLSIMEQEDKRIPGFICPVKMYRGENWAQIKRIK